MPAMSPPSDRLEPACRGQRRGIALRSGMPVASASQGAPMNGIFKSILIGSVALAGALLPPAAQADERKQLAFETIDRNAAEMAAISDSIFFFGEPGMQEVESTKLLKGTL